MLRRTMTKEQLGENVKNLLAVELAPNMDGEALPAVLINDGEHAESFAIMSSVLNKVIRPDMILMNGTQPQAGPVIEPETAPLRLLAWYSQPFTSPEPFDPVETNAPPLTSQQPMNAAVNVSAILKRQGDDRSGQYIFVRTTPWDLALGRTVLPQNTASSTFGHRQCVDDMLDATPAAWGA